LFQNSNSADLDGITLGLLDMLSCQKRARMTALLEIFGQALALDLRPSDA